MAIIVPNSGSTLSSSGSVPGSQDHWAWIGLQTLSSSGCVTWYRGASPVSGCELIAIALEANQSVLYGPFNPPEGLCAAGVSGGCALVWLKQ